ncbi:MAG: adenylate/guanylate cyclase domain-containing protein [Lysobacterales bacterium]
MSSITRQRLGRCLAVGAIAALGAMLAMSPLATRLDLQLYDLQQRLVRHYAPSPSASPVALIGIDETTVKAIDAPMALWHPQLAQLITATAAAGATVVGFDLVLPERSFDEFLGRANDQPLMQSILAARRAGMPVIFGRTLSASGKLFEVLPKFKAVLGREGFGMVLQVQEVDAVVRRYYDDRYLEALGLKTLVGQMARANDIEVSNGWIDYAIGGTINYVSMSQVLTWHAEGNSKALSDALGGKAVFVGGVLPFEDRHTQPLVVAGWENNLYAPGVLIHMQAYRSLASDRMLQGVSWVWYVAGLLLVALLVLVTDRPLVAFAGLLVALLLGFIVSTAVYVEGWRLSSVPLAITALMAWVIGASRDAWANLRDKQRMRSAFGGYVSPQILSEILEGNLSPELGGESREICLLFADLIGFTTLSETNDAEYVLNLLNRYFDRVTPAIHAHDGTLDKYMGDGIMAFFGAPKAHPNPAQAGFDAARMMLDQLDEFNEELASEGIATLQAGVGLGIGQAIVGHVGAQSRFEYSAIGDAVNVSARIEGLTRGLNCRIALSGEVAKLLTKEDQESLTSYGPTQIKGHTAIEVFGWGILNDTDNPATAEVNKEETS